MRSGCLPPQPVLEECITKDSEVQVKHGALKSLKQRRTKARQAARREHQMSFDRAQRQLDRPAKLAALQERVAEAMKPERERQEQKREQRRLASWLGRMWPGGAKEDVVEMNENGEPEIVWSNYGVEKGTVIEASHEGDDEFRTNGLVANELPPDMWAGDDDIRVDPESHPDA